MGEVRAHEQEAAWQISLYAEVRGFPATDTRRPGGGLDESQEIIAERATRRRNYLSAAWHVVFWQPERETLAQRDCASRFGVASRRRRGIWAVRQRSPRWR